MPRFSPLVVKRVLDYCQMNTITILCNAGILQLDALTLVNEQGFTKKLEPPLSISKPVLWNGECVFVAVLNADQLQQFTDDDCQKIGGWWRSLGRSNADWETHPWQPRAARKEGVFRWICRNHSLSVPRNVAAVLGDICAFENKLPVEFFNSLPYHEP